MVDLAAELREMRVRAGRTRVLKLIGQVTRVIGLTVEVQGINSSIGEVCDIYVPGEEDAVLAEVVGFRERVSLLMPLGELKGIRPGCRVVPRGRDFTVRVGDHLLGRVLDGLGRPMGEKGWLAEGADFSVGGQVPNPLERRRIHDVLSTGVRAIDACLTCGRGQRLGIFSGSGVGKSTLLGMIARYASADINVIALIGERGREVLDFIEAHLGDGLARSVVVAATSDQPALVRLKGAAVASALAEYFRAQGRNVLLLMDSVTRLAAAQREVGLAIGEPPATKGYTPSVFALLPRLLERSGMGPTGSITAFYTVLVDGDDMNEPIADAVRGILDGHIVLSRALAGRGHFPSIDILQSVSRLMPELVDEEHMVRAAWVREVLSTYADAKDLIDIGAYVPGSNPRTDRARAAVEPLNGFLRQRPDERTSFQETLQLLSGLDPGGE
ncbi:MAG: FliI/YscN family ATPase [Peptococcaceae bacterium]|jgi:flagellum-specific ATP synthase/type III secretion protein N (ATPase)|nr:FliI/YscN family ATPase [Peptococcaceae bacterium]